MVQVERPEVVGEDPVWRQVVRRHVEEALDRLGVQVEQQEPVGARERDEVRDQLRRDRLARLRLAFLARVPVVGDDRGHPSRRGPAQRVEDDEQLHQVLVHRWAGGLDHEYVVTAHRVFDLDVDLAIREAAQAGVGERHVELLGDELRQPGIGAAADQLQRAPRGGLLAGVFDRGRQSAYHS